MSRCIQVLILVLAILVPLDHIAQAGNRGTMFCDGGIVSAGDRPEAALAKCGQPALIMTGSEEYQNRGNGNFSKDTVLQWTYNFGSYEFVRNVFIYRGKIVRIEAGDKGWD
ncbi:MAG: DUF2845 domain-containing protein [Proteobacteria bacterium]|nr:DUF2845 domain-containing protein [Pseudomonadota bacterium]